MTIQELVTLLDTTIEMGYPTLEGSWWARVKGAEIKDGPILSSTTVWGKQPGVALISLAVELRGKRLVFNAGDTEKRREFVVPETLEVG